MPLGSTPQSTKMVKRFPLGGPGPQAWVGKRTNPALPTTGAARQPYKEWISEETCRNVKQPGSGSVNRSLRSNRREIHAVRARK